MTARLIPVIAAACVMVQAAADPIIIGGVRHVTAARGDTWASLGARHGVTPSVLATRNGLTLAAPLGPGDVLVVDTRHIVPRGHGSESIVVNVPQRMLFHVAARQAPAAYPVAVGQRTWQTPLGPFTVLAMETDPTWDVPRSIQEEMRTAGRRVLTEVAPGPANPLGRHWLGLSLPGIGIHGTNAPSSIFRAATHGCIRLHPDDIAALYARVAVGDRGRVVYEPVLVAIDDETIWLEVHPDVYRRVPDMLDLARDLIERAGGTAMADAQFVRAAVAARDGLAVDVTLRSSGVREKTRAPGEGVR